MKTDIMTGMTEDEFFKFCQDNDVLNFERNSNGEIIAIMPPGSEMGSFNSEINWELVNWNKKKKLGKSLIPTQGLHFLTKLFVLRMRLLSQMCDGGNYQKRIERNSRTSARTL